MNSWLYQLKIWLKMKPTEQHQFGESWKSSSQMTPDFHCREDPQSARMNQDLMKVWGTMSRLWRTKIQSLWKGMIGVVWVKASNCPQHMQSMTKLLVWRAPVRATNGTRPPSPDGWGKGFAVLSRESELMLVLVARGNTLKVMGWRWRILTLGVHGMSGLTCNTSTNICFFCPLTYRDRGETRWDTAGSGWPPCHGPMACMENQVFAMGARLPVKRVAVGGKFQRIRRRAMSNEVYLVLFWWWVI